MQRTFTSGALNKTKASVLLVMILAGLAVPLVAISQSNSSRHVITLKFAYDFTKNHACSKEVTQKCLKQFNVYDISGQKPYFLFSSPAPTGSSGLVKEITATSPGLLFENGMHILGIAAQMADGSESDPHVCKTVVEIKPSPPAN